VDPREDRREHRAPGPDASRVAALRERLLAWYRANRRDLPWRHTRDPYAIWLSEAMLQQTRVETVIPYWERFLARFPDVASLAAADDDDLLGQWAGLGYYSRARNLKRAAQAIVAEHAGRVPDRAEALRALPGIGRYTAGAVASIAFDREEPLVDGNVARVLARLLGLRDDVRGARGQKRLWEEAAALVRGEAPGDWNQALMELGATLCLPRAPRCLACPLAPDCAARASGRPEALPVRAPRAKPREVEAVAALVLRGGRALAVRRPPHGLLGGLWELPGGALAPGEDPAAGLRRALREAVGLAARRPRPAGQVEHAFTHRRLRVHLFRCHTDGGRVRLEGFDAHRWLPPGALAGLPHGAWMRRALALLGPGGAGNAREVPVDGRQGAARGRRPRGVAGERRGRDAARGARQDGRARGAEDRAPAQGRAPARRRPSDARDRTLR
jgi:A/G-specific adenine glycosylase